MKPRVLALDFDGTIAEHDAIDVDAAAAIREARDAGLLAVLVTGRILRDLDVLFRNPPPFDAIVAENGAVLRLPGLPSPITLSQRPDPRFLAELGKRGIRHESGQCVVEADADTASHIVEIIRRLGLPLAITFDVGRLMVLPHGVSKASGLQEALWRLRASVHNAVAIGNAENDHELLEVCEIGAAVAWGQRRAQALRRRGCAGRRSQGGRPIHSRHLCAPEDSAGADGAPSGAPRDAEYWGAARPRHSRAQRPRRGRPEVREIVDGRVAL